MERGIRTAFACLAVLAGLVLPAAAGAATIVVDTTEPKSTTECGLADAINAANNDAVFGGCTGGSFAAPDRIEFALPAHATIMLSEGLPPIEDEVAIVGPGAESLVVSGGDSRRVFGVAAKDASISGLTVADGKFKEGAGIFNGPGSSLRLEDMTVRGNEATSISTSPIGAGILNAGTLTVERSTISENAARTTQGLPIEGGGIFNVGSLVVEGSTIEANEVESTNPAGSFSGSRGGGIYNNGKLLITASTLNRNVARAGAGLTTNLASGAGLFDADDGETTVARSTVMANRVVITGGGGPVSEGGGIRAASETTLIVGSTLAGNSAALGANLVGRSTTQVQSTILAAPLEGSNCFRAFVSLGYNLEQGHSCSPSLSQPTDQLDADPLLGPLAANGGPTLTMALLPGSPAIDHGLAAAGETIDQRGLRRPLEIAGVVKDRKSVV